MRSTSNLPGFTAGVIMNNSLYQYEGNTEGYMRSDNSTIEVQALSPRFRQSMGRDSSVDPGLVSNGEVQALRRISRPSGMMMGGGNLMARPGLVGEACAGACAMACIGACVWNPFGSTCEGCVDGCMNHCTS